MTVYLLTYDLNKETQRPNITKVIKDNFAYAFLSESSYAIETDLSPEQVYNEFVSLIDSNDSLLVIPMKRPYYGQAIPEVIEWLDDNLPY